MTSSDFATGKHSWSVCDRCGFSYRYSDIVTEQGTNYRVCQTCNDGMWNLVTHPQNGPFPVTPDPQALRDPRPDVNIEVSVSTSDWIDDTGWN